MFKVISIFCLLQSTFCKSSSSDTHDDEEKAKYLIGTESIYEYSVLSLFNYKNGWIKHSEPYPDSTNLISYAFTPAGSVWDACNTLKTCYDCALGDCSWDNGSKSCSGRTTEQSSKGPTFDRFFDKAKVCQDDLNLCLNVETKPGNRTLGFASTNWSTEVPKNYLCYQEWNRGDLAITFNKSTEGLVAIMNENTGQTEHWYTPYYSKYYTNGYGQSYLGVFNRMYYMYEMSKVRLVWINRSTSNVRDL